MTKLTDEEEITRKSYDNYAQYWADAHSSSDFYKEERANFEAFLPTGRLLEIGSGTGWDSKKFQDAGFEYVGTDISAGLIALAKEFNPNARFDVVGVYDLQYDELFDGFWCAGVLQHIPRELIEEALLAIRRNLKPGAVGFISIKEGKGTKMEKKVPHDGDGRLFVYWQDEEFTQTLQSCGFTIVDKGYRSLNEQSKWLEYYTRVV